MPHKPRHRLKHGDALSGHIRNRRQRSGADGWGVWLLTVVLRHDRCNKSGRQDNPCRMRQRQLSGNSRQKGCCVRPMASLLCVALRRFQTSPVSCGSPGVITSHALCPKKSFCVVLRCYIFRFLYYVNAVFSLLVLAFWI